MCCSVDKSVMSDTKLYVGKAERNSKTVHVLAYQNTAASKGPNAMVIPFPTNTKMGEDNVIDTRLFKNFLTDIGEATKRRTRSASKGFSRGLGSDGFDDDKAMVFDVGSYTVILAESTDQIPEAVKRVPIEKRPKVPTAFLRGYAALYPNQPVAVCCWNGEIEAEPLLWWYEPKDATTFFIPTMDAHNGGPPVLGELVDTDHLISVGSTDSPNNGATVYYTDSIPANIKSLLPIKVYGTRLPARVENADCFVKEASLNTTPVLSRGLDYKAAMNGWH